MSELRAPDPTLTALDPDDEVIVWPYYDAPSVAHAIYVGPDWETGDPYRGAECGSASSDEVELPSAVACWFAVPCRMCFPDAPVRGHGRADVPDSRLAWQVPA